MKGRLNISEQPQGNDFTMSSPSLNPFPNSETSVIAESLVKNNEMILRDKLSSCENDIQIMKSLQISQAESTSKEKDLEPFWNLQIKGISEKLWLPIEIDSVGLDSRSSHGLLKNEVARSWFSKKLILAPKQNLLKICFPLSTSSVVGFTGLENTLVKSRKIRLYPNVQQRKLLRQWMGTARFVFNKTIEYLAQPGTFANWMNIKTQLISSLPKWSKEVPYQIKTMAVKEACNAVKNAKKKASITGEFQKVKFRSRKRRRDSIYIPKSAVKEQGIYPRLLGKEIKTFCEKIPVVNYDCHLTYEYGRYFLCVPIKCERLQPDNQREELVALDPGIRTFQTIFALDFAGKFGEHDFTRIYRLTYALDKIISKMALAKCKKRRRLRKASDRIRFKIRNLIDEIHHKTALWLCRYYNVIALPTFETSHMVTKLRNKVARAMLTWAHFRFKKFLKFKAYELVSNVLDMNEAYTSKTCTWCGNLNNIGSKSILKCLCGLIIDRDLNGARNIFLRALVDTPFTISW